MPDFANPQALNRFSYVANNPIIFIDPSGHSWCEYQEVCTSSGGGYSTDPESVNWSSSEGAEEDLFCAYGDERTCMQADKADAAGATFTDVCTSLLGDIPSYSTTCSNMGMAITIHMHPNANAFVKEFARNYFETQIIAHVGLILGALGLVCSSIRSCATAAEALLCGDLDCTNEIVAGARVLQPTATKLQSVYSQHAGDWGFGNWNPANGAKFGQTLQNFVNSPTTREIVGTYRTHQPAIHYVNETTRLWVSVDPTTNNLISAFQLSPQQLQLVLTTGNLP